MKDVFLNKNDIPKSCSDCPFSKKKYGVFDNPIICCITENIIREHTDDKCVETNRYSACPLKPVNQSS